MKKELPHVYQNRIDKDISNNKKVDYSGLRDEVKVEKNKPTKTVNQKINDIFNSPRYVYKAEVEIQLKDRTVTKKIIGHNKNQLITFDNEIIPISDIVDIKFTK